MHDRAFEGHSTSFRLRVSHAPTAQYQIQKGASEQVQRDLPFFPMPLNPFAPYAQET
jgi:hypothetical protein